MTCYGASDCTENSALKSRGSIKASSCMSSCNTSIARKCALNLVSFEHFIAVSCATTPCHPAAQGWDLAAACTPCGQGPWLSDPVTAVPLLSLSPSTDGEREGVAQVRGSAMACYIQKGMGVQVEAPVSSAEEVIHVAFVCPGNFVGTDQEKRYGLEPAPCQPCLVNQITHGNDSRAVSYLDASGKTVFITDGGYFSHTACVNPPGYGFSSFGNQPCDKGEFSPGYDASPCQQ